MQTLVAARVCRRKLLCYAVGSGGVIWARDSELQAMTWLGTLYKIFNVHNCCLTSLSSRQWQKWQTQKIRASADRELMEWQLSTPTSAHARGPCRGKAVPGKLLMETTS